MSCWKKQVMYSIEAKYIYKMFLEYFQNHLTSFFKLYFTQFHEIGSIAVTQYLAKKNLYRPCLFLRTWPSFYTDVTRQAMLIKIIFVIANILQAPTLHTPTSNPVYEVSLSFWPSSWVNWCAVTNCCEIKLVSCRWTQNWM